MSNRTDIRDIIADQAFAELKREGDYIFNGMLTDTVEGRLPEHIFRDYFLPRFLGVIEDSKSKWMLEWISIAGGPIKGVAVFRDNLSNVLFVVPPIFSTEGIGAPGGSGGLADIFARYKMIANNSSIHGLNFLYNALNKKSDGITSGTSFNSTQTKWLEILDMYGYLNKDIAQQQSNAPPPDDIFNFE